MRRPISGSTSRDRTECDPLVPEHCLLPVPERLLHASPDRDPRPAPPPLRARRAAEEHAGTPLEAVELNQSDGFSPGIGVAHVDARRPTSRCPIRRRSPTSTARSRPIRPSSSIDAKTGRALAALGRARHELAGRTTARSSSGPATNFLEGHRYVVGGTPPRRRRRATRSPPSPAFAAYRDGVVHDRRDVRSRAARTWRSVFGDARRARASRAATCSSRGTSRWRAPERSRAACCACATTRFAWLGGRAPAFTVTSVAGEPRGGVPPPDPRHVRGAALPDRQRRPRASASPSTRAAVRVRQAQPVRRDVHVQPAEPRRPDAGAHEPLRPRPARRPERGERLARPHDERDVQRRVLRHRLDRHGGGGHRQRDRDPAGPLALRHARRPAAAGLPQLPLPRPADAAPATASRATRRSSSNGAPLLDTDELYFDGNSQGAILGGALCAVARDFRRCVLGEAGMNYSTLLHRSVDFDLYKVAPRHRLPRPVRPARRAERDPDAVGPRRDERLRAAPDAHVVPAHAAPHGAAARRRRRPPGERVRAPGRGAHDGRRRPRAVRRAGPRVRRRARLRHHADPELSVAGLGVLPVGHRRRRSRRSRTRRRATATIRTTTRRRSRPCRR